MEDDIFTGPDVHKNLKGKKDARRLFKYMVEYFIGNNKNDNFGQLNLKSW